MVPSKSLDIDALCCLYDTYAPALYGVILKLTPDNQLASAILEKSFLKIWREMNDQNVSKGRLFTWMLGITLKECKTEVGFSEKNAHHLFHQRGTFDTRTGKEEGFFPG